ncbi:DUF6090 family protein [Robiginitalea aurantiaca]|uniref:DUF6090 family protein n=1 Tax=Robiginitalea aurantiaca TaxID=3056915 RepID=A0ABT7WBR9_9FLAO|nr:DUF6090 family protein [Robiginitalea aurantiaca]MDM9630363.1 DUF6090 family protein [Robiginitalea aurantiaca]
MISFFRNLRKKFLSQNHFSKYLLYAIGEIALVMVGILLALQVNNWNESKRERHREVSLLKELKLNLETNIENLEKDIAIQQKGSNYINRMIDIIDHKEPYTDSVPIFITRGSYVPDVILTASAFETLKSSGLELIESDTLRQRVIELFEVTYPYLMQETRRLEDQLWPAVVIPLMQKHFRTVNNMYVPVDYQALIHDQEFLNMWTFRGALRVSSTLRKRESAEETGRVITLIEKELAKKP